jgi:hypothetical protein
MSSGSGAVAVRVCGQGPFVEVGDPSAVAVSAEVIAVGGNFGSVQWNGRSVYDRSNRSVGWFPLGIYDATDLSCLQVLTTRWEINCVAIHPARPLLAIGTGAYDGGYFFEGELLIHDLERGTTVSVLDALRSVEELEWRDQETLDMVLAPPTGEDVLDWKDLQYESISIRHDDWLGVGRRSIAVGDHPMMHVPPPSPDLDAPRRVLADLARKRGVVWNLRRQAWAVAPAPNGGVLLGLESGVEQWPSHPTGAPTWRIALDGTCTQLFPAAGSAAAATVWEQPGSSFLARPAAALMIDATAGSYREILHPGHPAVLVSRQDGDLLVRNTQHGGTSLPATITTGSGETLGQVDLGGYDLFNHYFEIRRANDFLVLVGEDPRPHENKWVAAVRRTRTRKWKVQRLFPLAWKPGAHMFGGPGVFMDDALGEGLVHAGAVHSPQGLLAGNALVARRRFPDGRLAWQVPLDNQVTALDEHGGQIVAVTNLGELVVIDAVTGAVAMREDALTVGGQRVVPLSLAFVATERVWIGTLDGRAIEVQLTQPLR